MDVERFIESFDHHSPQFREDPYAIYAALRKRPPLYTETEGGFWVFSKYRDIVKIATDDDTFLSAPGITIPPFPFRNIPIDVDPPEFFNYRKFLNPFFSPAASRSFEAYIREATHRLIDDFIEKGQVEIVSAFNKPLPAMVTVRLLGLPEEDWPKYSKAIDPPQEIPRDVKNRSNMAAMRSVERELQERARCPRDDFMSALCQRDLPDGRRLDLEEQQAIVSLVFNGGLGTTTAALGNALVFLGAHPEKRQELIDHPELMPTAIEEFLRYDAPVVGLARTLSRDAEVGGQKLREGDRVLMLWASGNRDADEFDRPDEMVFDRHPNRHLAFGVGNHRCMGSNIARLQFRFGLEALLERIPDFRVERMTRLEDVGTVYECESIDVTFTPSTRSH